jgi:hypothetical protein
VLVRRGRVAGLFEQVRPHGQQPVMPGHPAVAVESGQQVKPRLRALRLRERDRPVEGDHWVGCDPFQDQVQSVDLRPVGLGGVGRARVGGRDGGL